MQAALFLAFFCKKTYNHHVYLCLYTNQQLSGKRRKTPRCTAFTGLKAFVDTMCIVIHI